MTESIKNIEPVGDVDKIQQILASIQNYIIDGNLSYGTELPPERDLAARLGVSRFSLREALRVAQAQGLIEITRGRKPRVAKPSPGAAAEMIALTLRRSKKSLLDLVVARQGIESQIARVAAGHALQSDISALEHTIEFIEDNRHNPELCIEQDIEFHNILVRATDNPVFEIMLSPLAELLRDSRLETIRQGIDRVITGHREILTAIKEENPEKAAEAMHRHLEMAEEDIRKMIMESDRGEVKS
jgi:GntR family transcriptional repressor for pyruvate dehydrogenase complex